MIPKPQDKVIGGVRFSDRFPHLQEDSDDALEWQWERDALAQAAAQNSTNYPAVHAKLLEMSGSRGLGLPRKRGRYWFVIKDQGDDLVVLASEEINGTGIVAVKKAEIAERAGGGSITLAWLEPSPAGQFVAVAWGADGDMRGTWSVYETESGRHIIDVPALMYTGARPGWLPDESGFWLNGRTEAGLHLLRFIPLNEEQTREIIFDEGLVAPKHSGLTPQISPDGKRAICVSEPHEHVAVALVDLETLAARPFCPEHFEGECDGTWLDSEVYIARVSGYDPRGEIFSIPASTSQDQSTWKSLVPAGAGFLVWAGLVGGKLYVGEQTNVSLQVRVYEPDGTLVNELPIDQPGSSPSAMIERCIRPTDIFAMTHTTFKRSPVILVHDQTQLRQIGIPDYEMEELVVRQEFATSKDGTRVPFYVVHRDDLDKTIPQPLIVTAYGGFNVSLLPAFPGAYIPFIQSGGIYVQANLRGGSEYGKSWHDDGRLFKKRNTFDDLEAVALRIVELGLSISQKMAFQGASNGGLLAGAAITFQPDLWQVVVPVVPVFDMMEMLPLTPETAGIRAIMYEDYGDPTDTEVAQDIIKWSPYHNIRDGRHYPAVFQVFGEHDIGCMPFHGRKFTARLLEASAGSLPIHLRVWRNIGHGTTDPKQAAAFNAEWLSFVMDQLGMSAEKLV